MPWPQPAKFPAQLCCTRATFLQHQCQCGLSHNVGGKPAYKPRHHQSTLFGCPRSSLMWRRPAFHRTRNELLALSQCLPVALHLALIQNSSCQLRSGFVLCQARVINAKLGEFNGEEIGTNKNTSSNHHLNLLESLFFHHYLLHCSKIHTDLQRIAPHRYQLHPTACQKPSFKSFKQN